MITTRFSYKKEKHAILSCGLILKVRYFFLLSVLIIFHSFLVSSQVIADDWNNAQGLQHIPKAIKKRLLKNHRGPQVQAPPPPSMIGSVNNIDMYNGPVQIQFMVIKASNGITGYDPAIRHLRRHLSILNYQGFQLLYESAVTLKQGIPKRVELVDDRTFEITLQNVNKDQVLLDIKFFNPNQPSSVSLNSNVTVARRGTFFVGGPHYNDGVLLLPITAWY